MGIHQVMSRRGPTGLLFEVDDIDDEVVTPYVWTSINRALSSGSVYRLIRRKDGHGSSIYIHQVILQRMGIVLAPNETVDHIDRDTLNNRRMNLRAATPLIQMVNQSHRTDGTSRFRGVNWDSRYEKWRSVCAGKHLGYFDSEEDAAQEYDYEAFSRFGSLASLNFPELYDVQATLRSGV